MLETASKFPTCQRRIIKALCAAFHVEKEDYGKMIHLVLYLKNNDRYKPETLEYLPQLHGALMIQHIFSFTPENGRIMTEGFLGLAVSEILKWVIDPIKSRIIEALLTSNTVPPKSKKKVIQLFLGKFAEFSMDKYASHLVDKCWAVAPIQLKVKGSKIKFLTIL